MPPLPHYTREWTGEVQRVNASDLDKVQHDKTLPISSIFWLKKPGESIRKLVVRSRCMNCQRKDVPCIRRDPCVFCKSKHLRCTYPKDPMLLPKVTATGPLSLMIPPMDSDPPREDLGEDVEKDAEKDTVHDIVVQDLVIAGTSYLMPVREGQHIPIHNGRPLKLPKRKDAPDASCDQPNGQSSSKKRRLTSKATAKKDKTSWTKVNMNEHYAGHSANRVSAPRFPYIWSESYAELLGAVPFLSAMHNGISTDIGPSPLIFVDDTFWSGSWSRTNVMQLETTRIFSCLESALEPMMMNETGAVDPSVNANDGLDAHRLLSIADEEDDSWSDMEFEYPGEDVNHEASATNSISVTRPSDERFLVASATENDPKKRSANIDLSKSFPPRLDDDIVRMYLGSSPISPTANRTTRFEEAPAEVTLPPFANRQGPKRIAYAPASSPDEIAILYRAYEGGMPVAVISDTAWTQFPFNMHEKCRYAVLGYFHIIDVQTSVEPMDSITRKNGLPRARGKMSWTFSLRWTPGGSLDPDIPIDVDGRPQSSSPIPWWLSLESELVPCTSSSGSRELIEPLFVRASILAWTIMRDAFEGESGRADASHRTWLCVTCGKLNVTNWIGAYICSFCKQDVAACSAKLIHAASVRDKLRLIPMWEPSTQIPDGVIRKMSRSENELRCFTYAFEFSQNLASKASSGVASNGPVPRSISPDEGTIIKLDKGKGKAVDEGKRKAIDVSVDKGVATLRTTLVVELLFLGNRIELEKEATALFTRFQRDVPMRFESTGSTATAGVFTFRVSPDDLPEFQQAEGCSNWILAPDCIKEAREMMGDYALRYVNRDVRCTLTHLSAMAWLGESPVKTEIQANAKEHPVMLMCLGADLDIIFAKPGEDCQQKKSSTLKSKARKGRPKLMDGVDESTQDQQTQISKAGVRGEIWGDGEVHESNKALMASDRLRITLTHGSMLVVSGCDIDLTVVRSDFAILIKSYHGC